MDYGELGATTKRISRMGLGCMSLPDETDEAVRIVHAALDCGVTFFDTADLYGRGRNEELLGQAFHDRRNHAFIATKVGNRWTEGVDGWHWDSSKKYIFEAVHASLRRLKTEYIDLYQLHGGTMDDNIPEMIEAFQRLKEQGLIRHYGISSMRFPVVQAFAEGGIATVQLQYNMLDRRAEAELLPFCLERGIGVIARGPLANGFLTGKFSMESNPADKDGRRNGYAGVSYPEVIRQVEQFKAAVVTPDRALGQAAPLFALANPAVSVVIPGARTEQQLETNVSCFEVPSLNVTELELIHGVTTIE